MRDLRHAVPGKRTWRGLAIRLDSTNSPTENQQPQEFEQSNLIAHHPIEKGRKEP
jgi:hypothetical protein